MTTMMLLAVKYNGQPIQCAEFELTETHAAAEWLDGVREIHYPSVLDVELSFFEPMGNICPFMVSEIGSC